MTELQAFKTEIEHSEDTIRRFWSHVTKSEGCWNWSTKYIYGHLTVNGVSYRSNRLSWEIHFGAIPDGLYVCHHCDNKRCIRPDHLFLGTHGDNMRDFAGKGKHPEQLQCRIICKRGHLLLGDNVYGSLRRCRLCAMDLYWEKKSKRTGIPVEQLRAPRENKMRKRVPRICEQCQSQFFVEYPSQKHRFCGRDCSDRYLRQRPKKFLPPKFIAHLTTP